MSTKTRIAKLEKAVKPKKITWKEFVEMGMPTDLQVDWAEFSKDKDCNVIRIMVQDKTNEHKKPTE